MLSHAYDMERTFTDVIGLWPNSRELANALDVAPEAVRKWKARDSIPPEYWVGLVSAADRAGIEGVTLDHLAGIASKAA